MLTSNLIFFHKFQPTNNFYTNSSNDKLISLHEGVNTKWIVYFTHLNPSLESLSIAVTTLKSVE